MLLLALLACATIECPPPVPCPACDEEALKKEGAEAAMKAVEAYHRGGDGGMKAMAPEGMGGIYNVRITVDGTSDSAPIGENRIMGEKDPLPDGAPKGGSEGLCLNAGTYPDMQTKTEWRVSHLAFAGVPTPTQVAATCDDGKPPIQSTVARCDELNWPACPDQKAVTTPTGPTAMLGAGVYSVVSTSHKGWVLGPEVQAKATLIVRPVSGDSKKLVETWCYENEFFWPLFGGQSRPGGSASTYNVTSNTIKMASNTADCAGTGDPKVCTKMSAAAECASVGPNLLSTRYLLTYD